MWNLQKAMRGNDVAKECVEEKGKQEERTQVVLVHRTNLF